MGTESSVFVIWPVSAKKTTPQIGNRPRSAFEAMVAWDVSGVKVQKESYLYGFTIGILARRRMEGSGKSKKGVGVLSKKEEWVSLGLSLDERAVREKIKSLGRNQSESEGVSRTAPSEAVL